MGIRERLKNMKSSGDRSAGPTASRPRLSVALTTYNGRRHLMAQVKSILHQLGPDDELVISDDGSTDGTIDLLLTLSSQDRRIRWVDGPRIGLIQNFANALRYCQGEIIFISDQDDVWLDDKVTRVLAAFAAHPKALLIQHDARFTDENLKPEDRTVFQWRKARRGILRNILKNSYQGCSIAIRRPLLRIALPFPKEIPMHDQWLGLLAELFGKTIFLDSVLMLYRRHGTNMTAARPGSARQQIAWRVELVKALIERWKKVRAEK